MEHLKHNVRTTSTANEFAALNDEHMRHVASELLRMEGANGVVQQAHGTNTLQFGTKDVGATAAAAALASVLQSRSNISPPAAPVTSGQQQDMKTLMEALLRGQSLDERFQIGSSTSSLLSRLQRPERTDGEDERERRIDDRGSADRRQPSPLPLDLNLNLNASGGQGQDDPSTALSLHVGPHEAPSQPGPTAVHDSALHSILALRSSAPTAPRTAEAAEGEHGRGSLSLLDRLGQKPQVQSPSVQMDGSGIPVKMGVGLNDYLNSNNYLSNHERKAQDHNTGNNYGGKGLASLLENPKDDRFKYGTAANNNNEGSTLGNLLNALCGMPRSRQLSPLGREEVSEPGHRDRPETSGNHPQRVLQQEALSRLLANQRVKVEEEKQEAQKKNFMLPPPWTGFQSHFSTPEPHVGTTRIWGSQADAGTTPEANGRMTPGQSPAQVVRAAGQLEARQSSELNFPPQRCYSPFVFPHFSL